MTTRTKRAPAMIARAAYSRNGSFKNSCGIAYVRLLQMLAAQVRGEVIGKMGTGVASEQHGRQTPWEKARAS